MYKDKSLTQSNQEVYNEILRKLNEYYTTDARKLAHYLRYEKHMTLKSIGKILGMSIQSVDQKYFKKKEGK